MNNEESSCSSSVIGDSILMGSIDMFVEGVFSKADLIERLKEPIHNETADKLMDLTEKGPAYIVTAMPIKKYVNPDSECESEHAQFLERVNQFSAVDYLNPFLTSDLDEKSAYLYDYSEAKRVSVVEIGRSEHIREKGNAIHLPTPLTSREHALVVYEEGKVYFVDFGTRNNIGQHNGSLNGCFMNGKVPIKDRKIEITEQDFVDIPATESLVYRITIKKVDKS